MSTGLRVWTKQAAFTNKNSFAYRCRVQRMQLLTDFLAGGSRLKILDIGGTAEFWTHLNLDLRNIAAVVLLNLTEEQVNHPVFTSRRGDATDLSAYRDQEFDLVFSNSVIEHVGSFKKQQKMAEEIKRVGKKYFIQTPNKWFPIEPHFVFPFFQFLPVTVRAFLLRKFNLGSYTKGREYQSAVKCVKAVRLLSARELVRLFPGARLHRERVCGLIKSFIVCG